MCVCVCVRCGGVYKTITLTLRWAEELQLHNAIVCRTVYRGDLYTDGAGSDGCEEGVTPSPVLSIIAV